MSRLVVSCLAALAFFSLVTPRAGAQAVRWEVLVYIAADNELEDERVQDVLELQRASNADVDILVQIDRAGGRSDRAIPGLDDYEAGARRFRVTSGGVSDVEDLGRINSGSRAQLEAFLRWGFARRRFRRDDGSGRPAFDALLVLGPGSAYRGCAADTSTRSSTALTAEDVRAAVNAAVGYAEGLALFATDCSFFATAENLGLVRHSVAGAGRLVAPESALDSSGFNLMGAINGLSGDLTQQMFAGLLVDTYVEAAATREEETYALGSFSSSSLSLLVESLVSIADDVNASEQRATAHEALAQGRAAATTFGGRPTTDPYNLVDLRELLQGRNEVSRRVSSVVTSLTPAAMQTRDDYFYVRRGSARTACGGLSIYFPKSMRLNSDPAPWIDRAYLADAGSGTPGTTWTSFIDGYSTYASADRSPPMVEQVQAQEAEQAPATEEGSGGGMQRMVRITATTAGDDIDDVTVTLGVPFERGVAFLGEIPLDQGGGGEEDFAGGAIDFAWNGAWIGLFTPGATDADPAAFFLLDRYTTEAGQARSTYAVPVEMWDGFSDVETLEEGLLVFDVDAATLEGPLVGLYAVDDSATDADGVYEVSLDADAVVIPMIPVISETGEWELLEGYPISTAGLSASSFDVPDGDYEIGLQVSDLAGNETTELVPVYLGPDVIVPASGGCSVSARTGSRGGLVWLALLAAGAVVARARRRAAAVAVAAMSSAAAMGAGCGPSGGSTSDAGRDARLFVMDTGACDDEDMDGVCDSDDACWGHPDGSDGDGDGVPDACDCDASGSMCDSDAECADGDDGVVCNCNPGFVGDGTSCIPEGTDGGMMMMTDAGMPDVDAGPEPDLGAVALFVDRASDRATLLYVATDGSIVSSGATTGAAIGNWDYAAGVVDEPADTARVLFYDTAAGGGRYVSIDLATREATVLIASVSLSGGWDVIEPVACDLASCDRYFFHDADAGTVAVVDFAGVGASWTPMQTDSGTIATGYYDAWRQAWNDGGQGRIGLHRPSDGFYGRVAITHTGADRGRFVRSGGNIVVDFLGGTFAGFDSVTPIAEVGWLAGAGTSDEVFNYRDDGSAQVGRMAAGSAMGLRDWPAGSFGAWTDIVTLDNGNTVFYDAAGSAGVVGRITVGGTVEFTNLATYTMPGAGFEHVTALLSPTP